MKEYYILVQLFKFDESFREFELASGPEATIKNILECLINNLPTDDGELIAFVADVLLHAETDHTDDTTADEIGSHKEKMLVVRGCKNRTCFINVFTKV